MNDRFKFRLWHKPLKTMHYNDFILSPTGHLVPMLNQCDLEFDKQCILMQSTGLKDKHGKLIYEGDIVKIGNGSINGSVIETTREVKWTINTWNVPVWVVDKPNFSHYVEVIGNIYENKELLEDTKCQK